MRKHADEAIRVVFANAKILILKLITTQPNDIHDFERCVC